MRNDVFHDAPYEQHFRLHATDLVRLLGLTFLPAAYLLSGFPAFLAMLLAHGGQWGLRYVAISRLQDWTGQAILLLAGVSSVFGLYEAIEWLDLLVHGLTLSLLVQVLGTRPDVVQLFAHGFGHVLYFFSLVSAGALLAVLWEVGEWIGFHYLDSKIGVGYDDTMGDLVAGIFGAGLGAGSALNMIRRPPSRLSSK